MPILRTDNQTDSVELLKRTMETADYYRDIATIMEEAQCAKTLVEIATERKSFIKPLQSIVTELGELPVQPDPDKELAQIISGELTKLLSANAKNVMLDKCLQQDEALANELQATQLGKASAEYAEQLDALAENINHTQQRVQALKDG